MSSFAEMFKLECKKVMVQHERKEALTRLLQRRAEEIQKIIPGTTAQMSTTSSGSQILSISCAWDNADDAKKTFRKFVEVLDREDKFCFVYNDTTHSSEDIAFAYLARDIAAAMPPSLAKKVLNDEAIRREAIK